jgi:hypothetical protein
MDLQEQFKVIFYSFIYGMFFITTLRLFKFIHLRNKIVNFFIELIFCLLHSSLFYFLLYNINKGILNYYIVIFLIIGAYFCKLFYFNDKKY